MLLNPDNPYIGRDELLKVIRKEFAVFSNAVGQDYETLRAELGKAIDEPGKMIAERQRQGKPIACAWQIHLELQWLAKYCTDWSVAAERLAALRQALVDPDHTDAVSPAQVADGSWGGCIREPYRRLEPTVDALQKLADNIPVKPLTFMTDMKLDDAKTTLDRLWRLQVTDIRATGRNNRDELGALQTALSQLIFKDNLRSLLEEREKDLRFIVSDELATDYADFLRQTQHPRTGYWGPWYRVGGQLFQVQDLSFTYHTINYRAGNVDHWAKIIETTLAIEGKKYPMGWAPSNGAARSHHNNYDVVAIFQYGWPHMNEEQKDRVRTKIAEMLKWCLGDAMAPNGFLPEKDMAVGDTYYYGIRFLDRLGFWDAARRFWSRRPPPLPPGINSAGALARRLSIAFEALLDESEQSQTVRNILRTATCMADGDAGNQI